MLFAAWTKKVHWNKLNSGEFQVNHGGHWQVICHGQNLIAFVHEQTFRGQSQKVVVFVGLGRRQSLHIPMILPIILLALTIVAGRSEAVLTPEEIDILHGELRKSMASHEETSQSATFADRNVQLICRSEVPMGVCKPKGLHQSSKTHNFRFPRMSRLRLSICTEEDQGIMLQRLSFQL